MFVVTAGGGEKADGLRAVAAEDEDKRAAFDGNFGMRLEIGEASDNFVDVASATVFVIFGEHAGSAVAMVDDFETGGLEAFDESSGAQSGGSFFAARQECGCAGGRANQGNLLLLTGYFDRQERLLKFAITGPGPRPDDPLLPTTITEIWLPESYTVWAKAARLGRRPLQQPSGVSDLASSVTAGFRKPAVHNRLACKSFAQPARLGR